MSGNVGNSRGRIDSYQANVRTNPYLYGFLCRMGSACKTLHAFSLGGPNIQYLAS